MSSVTPRLLSDKGLPCTAASSSRNRTSFAHLVHLHFNISEHYGKNRVRINDTKAANLLNFPRTYLICPTSLSLLEDNKSNGGTFPNVIESRAIFLSVLHRGVTEQGSDISDVRTSTHNARVTFKTITEALALLLIWKLKD